MGSNSTSAKTDRTRPAPRGLMTYFVNPNSLARSSDNGLLNAWKIQVDLGFEISS
jgi:hypothetical protein